MPVSEPAPIDILRQLAESTPVTTDTPEYGLGTDAQRITNVTPPAPVTSTTAGIIGSIYAVQPTVSPGEWRRFRDTVGRMLGFLPVLPENDDHD
jgi:hypothetical protein